MRLSYPKDLVVERVSCCRYLMAKEPAAQKKRPAISHRPSLISILLCQLIQLQVLEPLQLQESQLPQQEQQLA